MQMDDETLPSIPHQRDVSGLLDLVKLLADPSENKKHLSR